MSLLITKYKQHSKVKYFCKKIHYIDDNFITKNYSNNEIDICIYTSNNNIYYIKSSNNEGYIHNENGPAEIILNKQNLIISYFYNGLLHNINQPATAIFSLETGKIIIKKYYFNGECIDVDNYKDFYNIIKFKNLL